MWLWQHRSILASCRRWYSSPLKQSAFNSREKKGWSLGWGESMGWLSLLLHLHLGSMRLSKVYDDALCVKDNWKYNCVWNMMQVLFKRKLHRFWCQNCTICALPAWNIEEMCIFSSVCRLCCSCSRHHY